MKLLISSDIEGVAGVFHTEQTRPGNPEYERARRWMTAEANAAIEGAFAGGAETVRVNDSHGGFRNLLPDLLDRRAEVILGKPRYLGMMAGVEDCDAVFMLGYHGRSQSRGILAHTINSFAFARVWLGDDEVGEAGLYGALAESYGARIALIAGDDVLCEETRTRFPEALQVRTKVAAGFATGTTMTPEAACSAIRGAATQAVAGWTHRSARDGQHEGEPVPVPASASAANDTSAANSSAPSASPITCRLQTHTPALADLFCQWPSLTREDGVMIRFIVSSVEEAVRTFNSLSAMSAMLR